MLFFKFVFTTKYKELEDFWIGDIVEMKGRQGTGVYKADLGSHQAKVQFGNKVMVVDRKLLSLAEEEKESPPDLSDILHPPALNDRVTSIPDELDLHMEHLDPNHTIHQNRMLDYQLQCAKDYVQSAISARKRVITIIHGKGTGLLKETIKHYLAEVQQVRYQLDKHNGGATEVWLY